MAISIILFQMPYAEIRRFDCGQLRHPSFPEQIAEPAHKPLLREVVAAVESATVQLKRSLVRYSIEIKSDVLWDGVYQPAPAAFLRLVMDELAAAGVVSRTTLLCFDARILQLAHRLHPELATCLLLELDQPWAASIHNLGFVPTTFGPDFATVTPHAIQALRTNFPGVRLVPWTVNDLVDMRRLRDLKVDGITTDFPDRLLSLLAE